MILLHKLYRADCSDDSDEFKECVRELL